MRTRAFIAASAVAVVTLVGSATPASATGSDEGKHLGQQGQACMATYGFKSLGEGIHAIVSEQGNFAGGVPMGLATYC